MKIIDLHTHSIYSDGTSPPQDLIRRAKAAKVDCVWLMDHDTTAGAAQFLAAAQSAGLTAACGVEINTRERDQVHILGYGLRHQDEGLIKRLGEFRQRRLKRAQEMVERLKSAGLDISWDEVAARAQETIGRPHIADVLKHKGVVKNRSEAFKRFLSWGKPGYVEPRGPGVEEAIALIREFGGFAVLAHPQTVSDCAQRLEGWAKIGLEGIEAFYAAHRPAQAKRYAALADSLGLLATGGTDFHGPGSGRDFSLGVSVPDQTYDRFLQRLSRC